MGFFDNADDVSFESKKLYTCLGEHVADVENVNFFDPDEGFLGFGAELKIVESDTLREGEIVSNNKILKAKKGWQYDYFMKDMKRMLFAFGKSAGKDFNGPEDVTKDILEELQANPEKFDEYKPARVHIYVKNVTYTPKAGPDAGTQKTRTDVEIIPIVD